MFTVKFYKHFEDGRKAQVSVACQSYAVNPFDGANEVVCYKGLVQDAGEAFVVGKDEWQQCYVENLSGKTIDTVFA